MLPMYRFHYDYFRKKYPSAKMVFPDTDSLIYWVETADTYKEHFAVREHFEIASINKGRPFLDAPNNNGIGELKEEANGKLITEFLSLRQKMSSFLIDDKCHTTEKHQAKGMKRGASRDIRQQQDREQLQRPSEP